MENSFIFLGHFDWSMQHDLTVDTSKALGSRCAPQETNPIAGNFETGKGSKNPSFSEASAGDVLVVKIGPAAEI